MSHDCYLQRIRLQNYRCFDELNVAFDRHLSVLVANNGEGKTTVLDAVAIALSAFVGAFHNGRRIGIAKSDVRLQLMPKAIREMEPQYPCVLSCEGVVDEQPVQWQRRRNTPNSNNTYKEANDLIEIGERLQAQISDEQGVNQVLPLMAYYGTGRLWSQKKFTEKKTFEAEFYSRTSGFLDCLDPASSYKFFVDWFTLISRAHREEREKNEQRFGEQGLLMPTSYGALLKSVADAVNCCLRHTEWGGLRFSSITESLVVEHPAHGVLEVSQLSDGIRNMIALVADIAYRATRLNTHFAEQAAQKTPGVVLIDEVDMHLHPAWQQHVLQDLRRAFPALQFIVTTHSPQLLSSISKQHIRLLGHNAQGEAVAVIPTAESYARSNADVLLGVMDVEPIPKFPEQALLNRYRQQIEQGDIHAPELAQLRSELLAILGENHPELVRLALVMRRREILG